MQKAKIAELLNIKGDANLSRLSGINKRNSINSCRSKERVRLWSCGKILWPAAKNKIFSVFTL